MNTVISVIATLISSIALLCVAISLLLQARQLRASQLQASRAMQTELVKIAVDNPALTAAVVNDFNADESSLAAYLNLRLKYLETSYSLKAASRAAVKVQAKRLFEAEYPRAWWTRTRNVYEVEAATKREKEFFALVDAEYQDAIRARESSGGSAAAASA